MMPPHAYVPGQTPRHPDGLFDLVRETAQPGMTPSVLAASEAWQMGCRYAAAGYYWEAHEVWEPVWMACPPNGAEAVAVRGAIQLVNAALKARMGRPRAALRLVAAADDLLAEAKRRDVSTPLLLRDALANELRKRACVCDI